MSVGFLVGQRPLTRSRTEPARSSRVIDNKHRLVDADGSNVDQHTSMSPVSGRNFGEEFNDDEESNDGKCLTFEIGNN